MSENYIEELKQLKELLEAGIINQEDFDKKKEELLFNSKSIKPHQQNKVKEILPSTPQTKFKFSLDFITISNIIFSGLFIALIFFVCFAKIKTWFYIDNISFTITHNVFDGSDIRNLFAILAISFTSINTAYLIICIFIKNKYIEIVKLFSCLVTSTFLLLSFIFNITYNTPYLHACSLLGIIFTGIVIVLVAINAIYYINKYIKSKK